MRIIGGNLKGKKIFLPKDKKTRPLRDLVKESIFNIIEHSNRFECNIKGSNILDLFSGTGSFGLECISRNAKKVTFVENNLKASDLLKKNLKNIFSIKNYEIINLNVTKVIFQIKEKYDIFFLDPPFADDEFISVLKAIKDKKIYNKKNLVIIHREQNYKEDYSNIFDTFFFKKYGKSKITFGHFLK